MIKAIFLPGNGGGSPKDNWFPYLKKELEQLNIQVIDPEFPDNIIAPESSWIPFLHSLKPDSNTILIGHSSGAIAAMRYAEKHPLLGTALIGAYHTDLNIPSEIQSGYFNRPWNWEKIKNNLKWIVQFASQNDPWIPIAEARYVHQKLNTDYYESPDEGHFGGDYYKPIFPDLVSAIKKHL